MNPPKRINFYDYLKSQKNAILERWRVLADRDEAFSQSSRLSFREFLDDVPRFLDILIDYLEKSEFDPVGPGSIESVRKHGRSRWKQGFDLEELLRDWGKLQQSVLEIVGRYFETVAQEAPASHTDVTSRVVSFFTEASCASVQHFKEMRQQQATGTTEELIRMRRYLEQIGSARRHFLSDVSHELGSSLTAISGVSHLLKNDKSLRDDATRDDFGQIIDESVGAASEVLNSMLQLARIEAGQAFLELETIQVGQFLHKRIQEALEGRSFDVDFMIEEAGDFEATVDVEKLGRTVAALINFLEADSNGGSGRIRCARKGDSWSLQLDCDQASEPEDSANPTLWHRKEVDLLLLKRFSEIQKASFQLRLNEENCHEIVLRFPLELSD